MYPFPKNERHPTDYVASPEKMPELVLDSVREFAKQKYGVDLFNLESPLPSAGLPAHGEGAAASKAQAYFDDMGAICKDAGISWVMLSAGVTPSQFMRVMQYA